MMLSRFSLVVHTAGLLIVVVLHLGNMVYADITTSNIRITHGFKNKTVSCLINDTTSVYTWIDRVRLTPYTEELSFLFTIDEFDQNTCPTNAVQDMSMNKKDSVLSSFKNKRKPGITFQASAQYTLSCDKHTQNAIAVHVTYNEQTVFDTGPWTCTVYLDALPFNAFMQNHAVRPEHDYRLPCLQPRRTLTEMERDGPNYAITCSNPSYYISAETVARNNRMDLIPIKLIGSSRNTVKLQLYKEMFGRDQLVPIVSDLSSDDQYNVSGWRSRRRIVCDSPGHRIGRFLKFGKEGIYGNESTLRISILVACSTTTRAGDVRTATENTGQITPPQ